MLTGALDARQEGRPGGAELRFPQLGDEIAMQQTLHSKQTLPYLLPSFPSASITAPSLRNSVLRHLQTGGVINPSDQRFCAIVSTVQRTPPPTALDPRPTESLAGHSGRVEK